MKKKKIMLFFLCFSLLFGGCKSAVGSSETSSDVESSALTETTTSAESGTTAETAAATTAVTPSETTETVYDPAEISLCGNGVFVSSKYILKDKIYFLPAEDIAKSIGCKYGFDSKMNILTFSGSSTKIKMVVGSDTAKVNQLTMKCSAPLMKDQIVYAPLEFVCENLGCKVDVGIDNPDFDVSNSILVYSPNTIDLGDKLGGIRSTVDKEELGASADTACSDVPSYHEIYYDIALPQFTGLKDKAFQNKLNSLFTQERDSIVKDITDESKDALASGYGCYEAEEYSVKNIKNGIFSLTVYGDSYCGGVHGLQGVAAYTIDFNNSKILSLGDLFQPSADYKTRLLSEIRKIIKENPGEYQVLMPTSIDVDNFYIQNGRLVMYYGCYELDCYAGGIKYFKIPLKNISDILKDRYKNL